MEKQMVYLRKNTNYKDLVPKLVLNLLLQHVSLSWIIETNQQFEYDIGKHNAYLIRDGPLYNTSIC